MEIDIIVPGTDPLVQLHHDQANNAIARMSPSRVSGAETNVNSWRRLLTAIDPEGSNGYAFTGQLLQPGATAALPAGAMLVAVDTSWARAKWYAGQYIAPIERRAELLRVENDGLKALLSTHGRNWAREILGFLVTNRTLLEEGRVAIGPGRSTHRS